MKLMLFYSVWQQCCLEFVHTDQKLIVQDKKKCFFNRLIAAYSYSMKNVYIIFNIFFFFSQRREGDINISDTL